MPENKKATGSGCRLPTVFGVISPKISNSTVDTTVAIPTPEEPKSFKAKEVSKEVMAMFTILFPTKMVFKSLSFWSSNRPTRMAPLFFFERRKRIRNLLIERKALSDEEKIMERIMKATTASSSPTKPSATSPC